MLRHQLTAQTIPIAAISVRKRSLILQVAAMKSDSFTYEDNGFIIVRYIPVQICGTFSTAQGEVTVNTF